ncbi:hypothetical protein [Rufibacter immobilis]|nr:hypothetical protein [Rufibacter immobilis]
MTNNPNGRKPGVPNKVTTGMRERVNAFLDENFDIVQEDFKKLEPKDKLLFYTKLLSFGLPTLKAVEHTGEVQSRLDGLTETQLNELITKLLNELEQ